MAQSAKETAISDIREELRLESKSFIAFRSTLNPTISRIVKNYIQQQKLQSL